MGDALLPVELGIGRMATGISSGNAHTCALLDNGAVKCWGFNGAGELGIGSQLARGYAANQMGDNLPAVPLGAKVLSVALGGEHSCVVLLGNEVKCWGNNASGELGVGDVNSRGDSAGEVESLNAVALGAGRTASAVAAGNDHTCTLLDGGLVKCWGRNAEGQLGLGDTASRGDMPNEMGNQLPTVSLGVGRTAVSIAAGYAHTCALLDNGSAKCWGANESGQLGLGDTNNRGDAANEMGDSLPAINLGAGRTVTKITCGWQHTCALLDDREVKCWGNSNVGQLGLGDKQQRGDAMSEMGNNLPAVHFE